MTVGGQAFGSDDTWKCFANEMGPDSHGTSRLPAGSCPALTIRAGKCCRCRGTLTIGGATVPCSCNGCNNIWNYVKGDHLPVEGISTNAHWIWTHDHDAHNDVFCRFTVELGAGGTLASSQRDAQCDPITATAKLSDAQINSVAPTRVLNLGGDGQLVRSAENDESGILATVSIPLDYEIGIDITPGDVIESDWSSIAHFTASNTNCCEYGSRIPGIWFWPGTRKVLVVDGHGDNGNSHTGEWGCNDDLLTLEPHTLYTLKIVVAPATVPHLHQRCPGVRRAACHSAGMDNVKVCVGDPWYVPADAVVGNFYLSTGAKGFKLVSPVKTAHLAGST